MGVKVRLGNTSRVTKLSPESIDVASIDQNIKFDRHFYQLLGSLQANKTIVEDYRDNKLSPEYKRLLDELNDLYIETYYPELGVITNVRPEIKALDTYLGSLGVTETYPYSKDTLHIPAWLRADRGADIRVLTDDSDNTYLIDSSDGTVLVQYNI
jgi:hypothetical protein